MPRRHPILFLLLVLAALWTLIRLPPGQALIRLIVEQQLSAAIDGTVRIGHLRTNLWDEIEVHQVEWDASTTNLRALKLDSLQIRLRGGPPWSGRPASIQVQGLDVQMQQVQDTAAPESEPPAPATTATDWLGDVDDLREWIPDYVLIEDLQITVHDSTVATTRLMTRLTGRLTAARLEPDHLSPGLVPLQLISDGATLRLPLGRESWPVDAVVDLLIGKQWLILDGSVRTDAHHLMLETYGELSRQGGRQPLFDSHLWLGLNQLALQDLSIADLTDGQTTRLDSLLSFDRLLVDLAVHGSTLSSTVVHLGVAADSLRLAGMAIGQLHGHAAGSGNGDLSLDSLTISGPTGQVAISGQGEWLAPYPADLQITASGLDLAPWMGLATGNDSTVTGRVDAQLSVQGDLTRPATVTAHARGTAIRFGDLDLGRPALRLDYTRPALQARLQTPFGELRIDGTVADAGGHDLLWHIGDLELSPLQQLGGIKPITGTGQVSIHTSGAIANPQVDGNIQVDDIRLGALRVPDLEIQTTIDSAGQVEIEAAAGNLQIDAVGDWPSRQLTAATIRLGDALLKNWLARPWAQQWSGKLQLDLTAGGDLRQPRIDGRVGIAGLGLRGRDFGDLGWSISLSQGIAALQVAAFDSTARLSGRLHLDEGLPFELEGQLADTQLRPFLELLTDRSTIYDGHVRAGLHVAGSVADLDSTRIAVTLDDLEVSSPSGTLGLMAPSRATWQNQTLQLDSLRLAGSAGAMEVVGTAARIGPVQLQYRLQRLALPYVASFVDADMDDIDGTLTGFLDVGGTLAAPEISGGIGVDSLRLGLTQVGRLRARFSSANGVGRLDELQLLLPRGGSLQGSASFPLKLGASRQARQAVHAQMRLDSVILDSEQGLPEDVVVRLDGRIDAQGSDWRGDALQIILSADRVGIQTGHHIAQNQEPIHLTWDRGHLRAARSHFVVADTLLSTMGTTAPADSVTLSGDSEEEAGLTLQTQHIDIGVIARMLGVERPVSGRGAASARWQGAWPATRIGVQIEMQEGRVDSVQIDRLLIVGVYDTQGLRLDTLDAEASGGTLRGTGFVNQDSVRIAVDLVDFELAPLRHSMGTMVADVTGRLQGRVRMEGPRAAPRWEMQAAIIDGSLDIPSFEPALRFTSAQVLLTPDTLLVAGLEDQDGRWSLTAHAQIDNGRPVNFHAGMDLKDLHVVVPGTMDLTVDGTLVWAGTPDSSNVTGNVHIEPGHLTEKMSLRTLAFANSAAGAAAASLGPAGGKDSALTALRGVRLDVNLSGRQLLLDNELARIPFAAELVVGGTAAQPTLQGGLRASEGIIYYIGQEFEVSRTQFEFADARPLDDVYVLFHNPVRLDPTVDFAAATELKAKNGNEYDIFLGLGGTLADLEVTLTSDPAEDQVDILSLLNFGRTGVPMVDARGGMLSTGVNLSPNYLLAATESQFGRVLGLDNVEIDNSVLKPGQLAGSRIVLTKQLGKRTEMIYSTTVGYASQGRVQLQYDLGRHLYLQTQHDARGESGIDLNLKLTFK